MELGKPLIMLLAVLLVSACVQQGNQQIARAQYVTVFSSNQAISNPEDVNSLFGNYSSQIWDNTKAAGGGFNFSNQRPFFDYIEVYPDPISLNGTTTIFRVSLPIVPLNEQWRVVNGAVEHYTKYISGDETSEPVEGWLTASYIPYYISQNGDVITAISIATSTGGHEKK